nr:MAG TPA: hypothetical protein [Caudoviricetes sp.]
MDVKLQVTKSSNGLKNIPQDKHPMRGCAFEMLAFFFFMFVFHFILLFFFEGGE